MRRRIDKSDFKSPEPCGWEQGRIEQYAEEMAKKQGYSVGADLTTTVRKMGGRIELLTIMENGSSHLLEHMSSGTIFVHGKGDFDIFLPNHTGPLRDRFTIAHELGHYFIHSNEGNEKIKEDRFGNEKVEWEANIFAASFLMPASSVKELWQKHSDVDVLAAKFVVSSHAMYIRAQTLALL